MRSTVTNMRILITGGAGYLGSKLVPELLADGHHVTVLDRLDHGGAALVPFVEWETLEIIRDDIMTFTGAGRTWDVVLHLAAMVGEPLCKSDPKEAWRVNLDGSRRVHMLRAGRHVMFSTCSNYGVRPHGEPAKEGDELIATGVYSETKIAAEREWLVNNGIVVRFGTAAGVAGRMRFDTLLNEFARDAVLKRRIEVYQPNSWRPMVGTMDVVRYTNALINPHVALSGVYNVMSFNTTKGQMAETAQRLLPDCEIVTREQSADPRDYRIDASRAAAELSVLPLCDMPTLLQEVMTAVQLMHNPHDPVFSNQHEPFDIGYRMRHHG